MKTELKAGDKISAWVVHLEQPVFVEGILQAEEEGNWCEGELRLHTPAGHCYVNWFRTSQEAIEFEIEMAQCMIEFESEMWEATLKELKEDKAKWITILENHKKEHECIQCGHQDTDHYSDGCSKIVEPESTIGFGQCICWGMVKRQF